MIILIGGQNTFSANPLPLLKVDGYAQVVMDTYFVLVLVFAKQTRQALTLDQINEACYVDMKANKDVFDSMRKNPKVRFDGERFSYKVTFILAYMQTFMCSILFTLTITSSSLIPLFWFKTYYIAFGL